MDELIKMLEPKLEYINHVITDNTITIYTNSNSSEVICPYCGYESTRVHSYYQRSFQDMPIQAKKVIVVINNRKMFCDNPNCIHKTFAERFECIGYKSKKTNRLIEEIIAISINVSSIVASKIMKRNIAEVCKSTVCNIMKKKVINALINKDEVVNVCIDDFSLKRREKYGTVIVNLNTGKVIDMIESREKNDVINWLKGYPNIELVSRDGSNTYNAAVTGAHPKAIQVSDYFHLLKNLTEYIKTYIQNHLPSKIEIDIKSDKGTISIDKPRLLKRYSYENKWELHLAIKELFENGYNITKICKEFKMDIRTVKSLFNMEESESEKYKNTTTQEMKHKKTLERKEQNVKQAQELREKGLSKRKISEELGLDRRTITKYLNPDLNIVNKNYGIYKKSILDPYKDIIKELLDKGYALKEIYKNIKEKGYTGSDSNVRHYISKLRRDVSINFRDNENKNYDVINRKTLISLLFKPINKVKGITKEQFEEIKKTYPWLSKLYSVISNFKNIMRSSNIDSLKEWISECKELNIDEINSFLTGLNKDYEAVKNAINYNLVTNGVAEGNVNKIKVVKRIMYGKCSFDTLRKKILLLESW